MGMARKMVVASGACLLAPPLCPVSAAIVALSGAPSSSGASMRRLDAIFAGVSDRYMQTAPRGWGGDPTRGAALGRRERRGDPSGSFALSLRKIPLDAGGYDPAGTYFGRGAPLYNVSGEDASGNDVDFMIRAYDREDAREKALARYPNAKIRK